jgi:hypothetical protein
MSETKEKKVEKKEIKVEKKDEVDNQLNSIIDVYTNGEDTLYATQDDIREKEYNIHENIKIIHKNNPKNPPIILLNAKHRTFSLYHDYDISVFYKNGPWVERFGEFGEFSEFDLIEFEDQKSIADILKIFIKIHNGYKIETSNQIISKGNFVTLLSFINIDILKSFIETQNIGTQNIIEKNLTQLSFINFEVLNYIKQKSNKELNRKGREGQQNVSEDDIINFLEEIKTDSKWVSNKGQAYLNLYEKLKESRKITCIKFLEKKQKDNSLPLIACGRNNGIVDIWEWNKISSEEKECEGYYVHIQQIRNLKNLDLQNARVPIHYAFTEQKKSKNKNKNKPKKKPKNENQNKSPEDFQIKNITNVNDTIAYNFSDNTIYITTICRKKNIGFRTPEKQKEFEDKLTEKADRRRQKEEYEGPIEEYECKIRVILPENDNIDDNIQEIVFPRTCSSILIVRTSNQIKKYVIYPLYPKAKEEIHNLFSTNTNPFNLLIKETNEEQPDVILLKNLKNKEILVDKPTQSIIFNSEGNNMCITDNENNISFWTIVSNNTKESNSCNGTSINAYINDDNNIEEKINFLWLFKMTLTTYELFRILFHPIFPKILFFLYKRNNDIYFVIYHINNITEINEKKAYPLKKLGFFKINNKNNIIQLNNKIIFENDKDNKLLFTPLVPKPLVPKNENNIITTYVVFPVDFPVDIVIEQLENTPNTFKTTLDALFIVRKLRNAVVHNEKPENVSIEKMNIPIENKNQTSNQTSNPIPIQIPQPVNIIFQCPHCQAWYSTLFIPPINTTLTCLYFPHSFTLIYPQATPVTGGKKIKRKTKSKKKIKSKKRNTKNKTKSKKNKFVKLNI